MINDPAFPDIPRDNRYEKRFTEQKVLLLLFMMTGTKERNFDFPPFFAVRTYGFMR